MKKLSALVLTAFLVIFSSGFTAGYNPKSYSTDRIIETIRLLSSKNFNGRVAGTPDGIKTEEYIEARFKEIGLKPAGDNNTFFQQFSGIYGNPSGEYILEVQEHGKVIKAYKYGEDYKSLTNISHKGEVTASGAEVSVNDNSRSNGEIALVDTYDISRIIKLCELGYKGIIAQSSTPISRRKGQSGVEGTNPALKVPRVSVSKDVYTELADYCKRGCKIHLKSSYEVRKFTARNVIGLLKSRTPYNKYVIVSAHMDHLGPDPDGAYFPGALDNASGTACMIETARAIASQNIKPDVNVVFIAFSGEEEMLFGSKYYVQNPKFPLKDTKVINLDMIGAKSQIPLTIMEGSSVQRSSNEMGIADEFKNTANGMGITYDIGNGDGSDHSPFSKAGVPAVTLIDYEKEIYHVPEDNIDNIGEPNLKRAMDIIMAVLGQEIYKNSESENNTYMWIYIPAGALILAGAGILVSGKKRK